MSEMIYDLARRRTEAQMYVAALGVRNTPTNYEDRIKTDIQYRLAMDALNRAEADYAAALSGLTSAELQALAQAVPTNTPQTQPNSTEPKAPHAQ